MSEVVNIPQLRFPGFNGRWSCELFNNIVSVIDGDRGVNYPKSNDFFSDEYCLFLSAKNVTKNGFIFNETQFIKKERDELLRKGKLSRGDIVLTTRGTVGQFAFYSDEVTYNNIRINSGMVLLRNSNDNLLNSYFFKACNSFQISRQIKIVAFGSAQPQLTVKEINKIKINLPTKPEQQKIAAFLTAVDSKIEQLSKKQALLGSWKKGLMQQIFSQAIRFKADDGSAFPVWEEKNIVELAKTSIGLVTSMTPYYVDKGVPLIRNNDIFQNKIRKEKLIRLDYEFDQLNKNRRLFTNDIVTVHTGNIGASAVIDEELNGCQGFATLNTRIKNQNEISSSFLCWYYNSTRNIKYALSMATGDGRSNYNLKDFNKATIPVPSLPEQTKIAAFLTAADNKIEQVGKQFDESKQFKKALLQQMFV